MWKNNISETYIELLNNAIIYQYINEMLSDFTISINVDNYFYVTLTGFRLIKTFLRSIKTSFKKLSSSKKIQFPTEW